MIARVLRIGEHTIRIGEHEDTVDLMLRGDVSPDEVVRFFDFMASHLAGQRYMLVTGDVVQVGRIPAESRKRVVKESGRVPPIRGVVYYRVTFTGPGGHSYGAFGLVNPMAAMGTTVVELNKVRVPAQPKKPREATTSS